MPVRLAALIWLTSLTFLLVFPPVDSITAKRLVEINPAYTTHIISSLWLLLFASLHNRLRQVPPTLQHLENVSRVITPFKSNWGSLKTIYFSLIKAYVPAMAQILLLWLRRSHRDDLHIHSRQDCFLAEYVTIHTPRWPLTGNVGLQLLPSPTSSIRDSLGWRVKL